MRQTKELKGMLPNKIPLTLIELCKQIADSENKSLNEWLQGVLIKEVNKLKL